MSEGLCARVDEFLTIVRARLPEPTLRHIESVTRYLTENRDTFGITPEQATAAGLLHDLCKAMENGELITAARSYGLEPTPTQLASPTLLHGPVSAEECRRELKVDDPAVYEAIYWHTTGYPGLGPLGLALYFADFSEPLREHEAAAHARAMFDAEGFDAALRYVVTSKWRYVSTLPTVDPATEAFHDWITGR